MGMEILSAGKDAEKTCSSTACGSAPEGHPVAAPDLKELFSLGPANPDSGFPARIFPTNPPTFEKDYTLYYDALSELARKILSAMTIPLKLPRVSVIIDNSV